MNEGDTIKQTFLETDDVDVIKRQYADWAQRTYNFLNLNLGISYALQFKNAHGSAWMGMPLNHKIEGGNYTVEIQGKSLLLNEIINELRRG